MLESRDILVTSASLLLISQDSFSDFLVCSQMQAILWTLNTNAFEMIGMSYCTKSLKSTVENNVHAIRNIKLQLRDSNCQFFSFISQF